MLILYVWAGHKSVIQRLVPHPGVPLMVESLYYTKELATHINRQCRLYQQMHIGVFLLRFDHLCYVLCIILYYYYCIKSNTEPLALYYVLYCIFIYYLFIVYSVLLHRRMVVPRG